MVRALQSMTVLLAIRCSVEISGDQWKRKVLELHYTSLKLINLFSFYTISTT